MVSFEELKAKYPVVDEKVYGMCVVVPAIDADEFGEYWEQVLRKQGSKIFQGDADGKAVFFITAPVDKVGDKIVEVYRPPQTQTKPIQNPPRPMHDPERRWSPVDDAQLINFYEAKKSHEEMTEYFPGRNEGAIKGRLQRLRKAGKIQGRQKRTRGPGRPPGSKTHSKPSISDVRSTPSTLPSPELAISGLTEPPRETAAPVAPISTPTQSRGDAQPFQIRTTLTLNLNVNCADSAAVDAAIQVLKEVRRT